MCTALSYATQDHYFGRNLDIPSAFRESVVVTPRRFPFRFRRTPENTRHFAMIGMAAVIDGYPLYYDATNEHGLSMAGLSFPGNACYLPEESGWDNVSPFEFIPFILCQCKTVADARRLLARVRLAAIPFSESLPLSPLHFIISDKRESITVEPMKDGLHVDDNPIGVLTNNPPFGYHMHNLSHYLALSPQTPENTLFDSISLRAQSLGLGALGLPGDCSSVSRFVRAAYTKAASVCGGSESESVSQFFHLLGSVRHVRGSVLAPQGYEITLYSSCCNTDRGVYYYTTYENSRITGVSMHREDLDAQALVSYPLLTQQDILMQNSQ
ncbi:MAG: choloylglycine hydrolase [Clostridia bacterium]|nr:choloylglycine hydrolase [Clostridia bacterium]